MKKYSKYLLIIPFFLFGCLSDPENEEGFDDDEQDEVEELSEFGEMMAENFEDQELPYHSEIEFDNYEPDEFINEEDFRLLELMWIFPEGWAPRKYASLDKMVNENDITILTMTALDDQTEELSTYLITYNDEEWYVSHLMIAYDGYGEDFLTFKSEVNGDTIIRTNYIDIDTEILEETERFFIDEDGNITSENDL